MFSLLKQTSLSQAGFAPLSTSQPVSYVAFNQPAAYIPASEIRYVHACQAQDGARLYVYSWLDAPGYLLSTQPRITALGHIFAELDTDEPEALQAAVNAFFELHGGAYQPLPGPN
jgi:hypothetical protein